MRIGTLEPSQVLEYWPSIHHQMMMAPQVLNGKPPEYYIAQAMARLMQVWMFVDDDGQVRVTVFSEIRQEARGRVMEFVAAWGTGFEDFIPLLPSTFENIKTQFKVDLIEIEGRAGWAKMLAPLGFKVDRVTLSKYLERTVH